MPLSRRQPTRLRAVIFDLDEVLLLRARAWQYALEEAVASICGRRVDAGELVNDYRLRPWHHAAAVVVERAGDVDRCAALCREIFYRSAMKRLLVHEGLGMALDHLRGARLEMGAISREEHAIARLQVESTGLDRFITVLSASPAGEPWDPVARADDCLAFLEREASASVFVSGDDDDLARVSAAGYACLKAQWACGEGPEVAAGVDSPSHLPHALGIEVRGE